MIKATPFFRWFDLWVGAYIDVRERAMYLCPCLASSSLGCRGWTVRTWTARKALDGAARSHYRGSYLMPSKTKKTSAKKTPTESKAKKVKSVNSGITFISCPSRTDTQKCSSCGSEERSTVLCEYPLAGRAAGRTCGRVLCKQCAVSSKKQDFHLCPVHDRLMRQP